MSTSSRGSARERTVRKQLEKEGWVVVRSAASASPVDLWSFKVQEDGYQAGSWVMALQIKANKGNAFMNFRKAERRALSALSEQAGATPWLIHWPPHGEQRWIPVSEWPK